MLGMGKFASLNGICPLTLPSCCRPVRPRLHRAVPRAALAVLPVPCRQHLFLPTHFFSISYLHVILGMMDGRRRTSPPSLFTVSPCIHACFKSTINMCSGPHSVAGLSVWGTSIVWSAGTSVRRCGLCADRVSGCVWLGSRRWEGSSAPIHLISHCSSCAPASAQPLHCPVLGLLV